MLVAHLTASTFYGGPERQMLGLGHSLAASWRSVYLSFPEGGRGRAFVEEARRQGLEADVLRHDSPHFYAAIRELGERLRELRADVLCCHGYKASLLGSLAARRPRIPVVAVSRGWTGETFKVRMYEALDRFCLRWLDRVVCVSEGQAVKVRRAGVAEDRLAIIRNAIRTERFVTADPAYRTALQGYFATPRSRIVGAAGRLSPEKGFDVLIDAAVRIGKSDPTIGFVLFGDGALRADLERRLTNAGLGGSLVLAGFRNDLDQFLPFFDLLVLPSHTEGLPNVVLEAFAAGVPVVATAVGGTPEVVEDGVSGFLVPPGDAERLAERMMDVLASEPRRRAMGERGRQRVAAEFTFEAQARAYERLFDDLRDSRRGKAYEQSPRQSGTHDRLCREGPLRPARRLAPATAGRGQGSTHPRLLHD